MFLKPSGHRSIRTSLMTLVVACVLPAVLISAALVVQNYRLEKQRAYDSVVFIARNIASDMDRELAGVEAGLRVLAASPELQRDDLAGFYAVAQAALPFQLGDNFVLINREGWQVLNTLKPYGTALPRAGNLAALEPVFTLRKPMLTGLFNGPVTHQPVVAMGVPVFRGNAVAYILVVGMSVQRVASILTQQSLPKGWVGAVLDSHGTIVARTLEPERFVGQTVVSPLLEAVLSTPEGTLERPTRDGTLFLTAFSRATRLEWIAVSGAPSAEVSHRLFVSLAWVALTSLLAVALGLWFALRLAGRITSSVRGLIKPALAIGSGLPVSLPPTSLDEAAAVGEAIVQASRMLTQARHSARHDVLTGLANRLCFSEIVTHQMAVARRGKVPLAILAIDLDGFKSVNDQHGHAAGDLVLKLTAERIADCVRESDLCARLGGDEFAVMLFGAGLDAARGVGQKLVQRLSEPYPDIAPQVSASVGVAIFPGSGEDLDELLKVADKALYKAKANGKRQVTAAA